MHCPKCRNSALRVAVAFTGDVYCDFSADGDFRLIDEVALDSSFSDDGDCCCPECGWEGRVRDARAPVANPPQSSSPTPLSSEQLARLRAKISMFQGESRRVAETLFAEVQRLNVLLDTVSRFGGKPNSTSDTAIG